MKYTIVNILKDAFYDRVSDSYFEKGEPLKAFDSKREAFEYAKKSAEDEVESLMDGCPDDHSFGVPEDDEYQSLDCVKVCYYDHDDDSISENVTVRHITPLEQEVIPGTFYDLDGDKLGETPALDDLCISLAKMYMFNYPDYIIYDDNDNLDNDMTLAIAAHLKNNRYAFLDAVENLVDEFMCEA